MRIITTIISLASALLLLGCSNTLESTQQVVENRQLSAREAELAQREAQIRMRENQLRIQQAQHQMQANTQWQIEQERLLTESAARLDAENKREIAGLFLESLDELEQLWQDAYSRHRDGTLTRTPCERLKMRARRVETEIDILLKKAGTNGFTEPEEVTAMRSALQHYWQAGHSLSSLVAFQSASWLSEAHNHHDLALADRQTLQRIASGF